MSIKVTSAVWDKSNASGSDLLVMLYIADRCNDDGTGAYPSVSRIAKACRLSERGAHYAINSLIQSGELSVKHGAGPKRCNVYSINIPLLGGCNPCRGAKSAPCKICTQEGAKSAPNTSVEPSLSLSTPSVVERESPAREEVAAPKTKRPTQIPADFELTDARFNYAASKGFDKRRIETTFEKFTNYWTGCGKPKKDWDATWRTWVLNEVDRVPRSNARPPVSTAQDFMDIANRLGGRK